MMTHYSTLLALCEGNPPRTHKEPVISGLILGLRPANERRRYKVTPAVIGWVQTQNQPQIWKVFPCEDIIMNFQPPVNTESTCVNVKYMNITSKHKAIYSLKNISIDPLIFPII